MPDNRSPAGSRVDSRRWNGGSEVEQQVAGYVYPRPGQAVCLPLDLSNYGSCRRVWTNRRPAINRIFSWQDWKLLFGERERYSKHQPSVRQHLAATGRYHSTNSGHSRSRISSYRSEGTLLRCSSFTPVMCTWEDGRKYSLNFVQRVTLFLISLSFGEKLIFIRDPFAAVLAVCFPPTLDLLPSFWMRPHLVSDNPVLQKIFNFCGVDCRWHLYVQWMMSSAVSSTPVAPLSL